MLNAVVFTQKYYSKHLWDRLNPFIYYNGSFKNLHHNSITMQDEKGREKRQNRHEKNGQVAHNAMRLYPRIISFDSLVLVCKLLMLSSKLDASLKLMGIECIYRNYTAFMQLSLTVWKTHEIKKH